MIFLTLVLVTVIGTVVIYFASLFIRFIIFAGALVFDMVIIIADFLALMLFIRICKKIYTAIKKNR